MSSGRITLYVATSLDGYIADPDGGVEWLEAYEPGPVDEAVGYEAFFSSVDALVMGSATYEQILDFGAWPYEDKPVYVLTTRDLPLAHEEVHLVQGDVDEIAMRLTEEHEHIWLVGGAHVAQAFLEADRIDELRLTIAPVILGGGIPLFGEPSSRKELEFVQETHLGDGLVEMRYELD